MDVPVEYLEQIRLAYPDARVVTATLNQEGLVNDIVIVNDELVFRFPKHDWAIQALSHEARILDIVGNRVEALLADIPAAWSSATQAQLNKLAHLLFERIVVENTTVVAIEPRPDFAPFFVLDFEERLKVLSGGSDGDRSRGIPRWYPFLVPTPERGNGRYTEPITRLEPELWPEVRDSYESGESLRAIARDYGVSYEAIRGIVQRLIQGVA